MENWNATCGDDRDGSVAVNVSAKETYLEKKATLGRSELCVLTYFMTHVTANSGQVLVYVDNLVCLCDVVDDINILREESPQVVKNYEHLLEIAERGELSVDTE